MLVVTEQKEISLPWKTSWAVVELAWFPLMGLSVVGS